MTLTLDIVTPKGSQAHVEDLDSVVVRRREQAEPGSEVAIYPRHAALLMQIQQCSVRVKRGAEKAEIAVGAGVVEVLDDVVTLVVLDGLTTGARSTPQLADAAADVGSRRARGHRVRIRLRRRKRLDVDEVGEHPVS